MRVPDLEIDLLRSFSAVALTGSFTTAAELVGRSQSAISQRISRLEATLGQKLFERTAKAVVLTRNGERLLASARRLLDLNDAVVRDLMRPTTSGNLRLGICEDFIPSQLPQLLSRFSHVYPDVHLELMTGLSGELHAAYRDGQLDAVIAKKDGGAKKGRVIWREPLVWTASSDYEVDFSQPARLVMLRAPCAYRDIMITALDSVRQEWMSVCTASSLMGVQAAVAGGLGITVLGATFVRGSMTILQAPDHWPALPMTEIAVVSEDDSPTSPIGTLVTFLTGYLAASENPYLQGIGNISGRV
ncbi:LysR substrate-binding domain-containing protein [Ochrobactrum teleogrylli]|uniref:LysR substrate-binding domain-containing protein n=1 Tax=Ochrobactrum teleogrylli TaxID=2479765 RepID=A0ABD5K0H0_9HYPH